MPTVFEPRSFFFIFLALLISLYAHFHSRYMDDKSPGANFIQEVTATITGPFSGK